MARPKTQNKKVQINLTVDKFILAEVKKILSGRKSLSQLTEELYQEYIDSKQMAHKTKEELLNEIKRTLAYVELQMVKKEGILPDVPDVIKSKAIEVTADDVIRPSQKKKEDDSS